MSNFTPQEIEEFLQEFFDVVGTRQYVGARYVPIFGRTGESSISWDNSLPYEPLTIVLYRNSSYTSRTYVPAGVPITDTDFWVQTGNYNAQVEAYRQETLALVQRMDYLEEIIPNEDFTPTNTVKQYFTDMIDDRAQQISDGVDDKVATKVPWPLTDRLGTAGQVLRTNGDNTTTWVDPNLPSEELMRDAVDDWLEANPEVTQPDVTILQQQNQFWPVTPMQLAGDVVNAANTIRLGTRNGIWNTLQQPSTSTLYVTITPLLYIPPFTRVTVSIGDTTLYYRARFKELQNNMASWQTSTSHARVTKSDGTVPDSFTTGFNSFVFSTKYVPIIAEIDVRNADTSAISPESVTLTAKMESVINDMEAYQLGGIGSVLSNLVAKTAITPAYTSTNVTFTDLGSGRSATGYTLNRYTLTPNTDYMVTIAGEGSRAMLMDTATMDGTHDSQPLITTPGTYVVNAGTNVCMALSAPTADLGECGVWSIGYNANMTPTSCIFYGTVFFTHDSRFIVYRNEYAYGIREKSIINMSSAIARNTYVELASIANNINFIVFDGTAIVVRTQRTLLVTDMVIAVAYANGHTLYPVAFGTIVQELPVPDTMYKRSGVYGWFDKASAKPDYVTQTMSNAFDFGDFYRFGDTFNTPMLGVSTGVDMIQAAMTFRQNQVGIDNKKILTIGDSFTNRGWYQQRILTYNSTVEFVGTRTTQNNNLRAEGYSGLRSSQVLGAATLSPAGGGTIDNPFYDPNLAKCTLEHYCRTTGIIPDYVVIEFMLNENSSADYYNYIQDFIDTVKSYDQDIVVYVMQMKSDVSRLGSSNALPGSRRGIQHQCLLNSFSFTDCVLVPCWFILTDEYDYNHTEVAYGVGDVTIDVLSDGVHPAETTGFAKLGDQLYNYLGVSE